MNKDEMWHVYELCKEKLYPSAFKAKMIEESGSQLKISEPTFYQDTFDRCRIVFEIEREIATTPRYIWFSISPIPFEVLYLTDDLDTIFIANRDFSQTVSLSSQPQRFDLVIRKQYVLPRWAVYAITHRYKSHSIYDTSSNDNIDNWTALRNLP
jgi:hypothetical protein